ncbi:MAG TPA: YceI family protein [Candidatus Limnocylindrales bacterium]|nr:YceI family protein [Candidatus Limnocylindrales bacterium]HXJ11150.1 YceI family protein [Candidatus Limnocylindrales bacterium]
MRAFSWKSTASTATIIFCLAILPSAAPAPPHPQATAGATHEVALTLDPAQTKVHFNVDSTLHMVHGTLALKSGSLQFDPQSGKSSGSIVVNAVSCDTGNSSRDQRLHKEILETWKFAEAAFRPTQIDGQVSLIAPSDFKLKGVITLHGTDHELVVNVHSEFSGDHWKGTAKFDVPYTKWGIKDPSNFLLKVKPIVNVELELYGSTKDAH